MIWNRAFDVQNVFQKHMQKILTNISMFVKITLTK